MDELRLYINRRVDFNWVWDMGEGEDGCYFSSWSLVKRSATKFQNGDKFNVPKPIIFSFLFLP